MNVFGIFFPTGSRYWMRRGDVDFTTTDINEAQTALEGTPFAKALGAYVSRYQKGHNFVCGACTACRSGSPARWCPHASNRPAEIADLARKLWETDDRIAPIIVAAAEGRDPSDELLDRLYEKDIEGLRRDCEARAELILGL